MNSFDQVIQALSDAFLAAQLGNAVLATQAVEHDTDLALGRKMASGLAPDVLHHPLSRGLAGRLFQGGLGFIFVPSSLRRSPKPPNSQPQICAIGADGGQWSRCALPRASDLSFSGFSSAVAVCVRHGFLVREFV
jgi:hypothetical protein